MMMQRIWRFEIISIVRVVKREALRLSEALRVKVFKGKFI